jgi:glycosyltransferase involved in cell wall biosynthesis
MIECSWGSLRVSPKNILPYDWKHEDSPENWHKDIPEDICTKELLIFFAGTLSKEKGVYDLIESVKHIRKAGRKIKIKIAGKGDADRINSFANKLGVTDNMEILGLIDHDDVLTNMNKADVVVVPSHHAYPEGMPMTIMESLMVHTPVIASDHPMFVGRVGERGSVLFFQEQKARDLGEKILSVCSNLEKYRKMCINAPHEWDDLILQLKWADMINIWINNPNHDFVSSSLDSIFQKEKA